MDNCIFCRIAQGEIPAHKIYEDSSSIAFLDVRPHAKGHTVIIPKTHADTVFDLDEQSYQNLMHAVRNAMLRISEVLHPDGFNVGWNHLPAAGQVVPHVHIHILPRYKSDGGGSMHSIIKNPGEESVEEVAGRFN